MRTVKICVDLRAGPRRLVHAEIDIPVQPSSTARLTTPLYLCETHVPNGPISAIAGLSFSANGRIVSWRRDPFKPYVYILEVGAGVDSIHASFDAIVSPKMWTSRNLTMLAWDYVLLHLEGRPIDKVFVEPSITLPAGWEFGTALRELGTALTTEHAQTTFDGSKVIDFQPVTLERLEDSPVLVGRHMIARSLTLDGQHMLHLANSRPFDTDIPHATLTKISACIYETCRVFGPRPYSTYHFLVLGLPGLDGGGGMEHAECCQLFLDTDVLMRPERLDLEGDTICHEFVHAWNGKYRRPAGHVPKDFSTPLDGSLLWVYEGLSQYYGYILALRSGTMSYKTLREKLASAIAQLSTTAGRQWRSIQDTGTGVALGRGLGLQLPTYWRDWIRSQDYYDEGALLWLEVDTLIRQKTGGAKSLDDFCQSFFGQRPGSLLVTLPYTLDDIVTALNRAFHFDWSTFFRERVEAVVPEVNLRGVEQSGHKFAWTDQPSGTQNTPRGKLDAIWNTIGLRIDQDGLVGDVRRFGPSDVAEIAPGHTVTKIGEEVFSVERLLHALKLPGPGSSVGPILVTVSEEDETWQCQIAHNGGIRYPFLQRIQNQPDILAAIVEPRGTS